MAAPPTPLATAADLLGEPHVYKQAGDTALRVFAFKPTDWQPSDAPSRRRA